MAKQLQETQHKHTTYNRPNVPWECGHMCEGKSCALGPTPRGFCRGQGECIPVRKGDRWECSRDALFGGACESGPNPDGSCCHPLPKCSPRRTVRSQRKVAILTTVAFTIGLVAFLLSPGPYWNRNKAIMPGPLAKVHGGGGMTCADCHSPNQLAQADNADEFIHGASGVGSKNCLECHQGAVGDWETARFAHGLPPEVLRDSAENREGEAGPVSPLVYLAGWSPVKKEGEEGSLDCAACHQEHHGRDFDLAALSDRQCQVCHTQQFASFSNGHPDIRSFQSGRRSRIYFDHATHMQKYFPAKKKEWESLARGQESCRVCHSPEPSGQDMMAPTYEAACAACHDDSTRRDALEVLAIPAMNPKAVEGWPLVMVDPPSLSPVAEWLLAQKGTSEEIVTDFSAMSDPRRAKSDEEKSASMAMKEELMGVLRTLQQGGPSTYFSSAEASGGIPAASGRAMNAMLGAIPPAVFEKLLRDVHGAEEKALEAAAEEKAKAAEAATSSAPAAAPTPPAGGGNLLQMPKAPAGGGNLLQTPAPPAGGGNLLQTPAPPAGGGNLLQTPAPPAGGGNLLQTPAPPAGGGNLLQTPAPPAGGGNLLQMPKAPAGGGNLLQTPAPPAGGGNLLQTPAPPAGGNLLQTPAPPAGGGNLLQTPAPPAGGGNLLQMPKAPAGGGNLLQTPAPPAGGGLLSVPGGSPSAPQAPAPSEPEPKPRLQPELDKKAMRSWASNASWSYSNLRISYRPQGHGDPFLMAWLENAAATAASPDASEPVRKAALAMIDSAEAGSCLMCHTVDRNENGSLTINWRSQLSRADDLGLTAFKHSKHINSLKVAGMANPEANPGFASSCITCHILLPAQAEGGYASQFAWERGLKAPVASDPHAGISNFASISLQQSCATCHTEQRAGASCLTCHKYHSHWPLQRSLDSWKGLQTASQMLPTTP